MLVLDLVCAVCLVLSAGARPAATHVGNQSLALTIEDTSHEAGQVIRAKNANRSCTSVQLRLEERHFR